MSKSIRHSKEYATPFEDFAYRHVYETELILSRFSRSIHEAMVKSGKSQKDIASITNKSPQSVSRAISAEQNLTVSKMVELSLALGCQIDFSVAKDAGITVLADKSFLIENVTTFDSSSSKRAGKYIFGDSGYTSMVPESETKAG